MFFKARNTGTCLWSLLGRQRQDDVYLERLEVLRLPVLWDPVWKPGRWGWTGGAMIKSTGCSSRRLRFSRIPVPRESVHAHFCPPKVTCAAQIPWQNTWALLQKKIKGKKKNKANHRYWWNSYKWASKVLGSALLFLSPLHFSVSAFRWQWHIPLIPAIGR